ncbi:MAG: hypothetical protein RBQ81_07690 [Arcobacteraceae bacterium]|jgi:hypothetical protein|nr:hypothetical protein [Arcobacteraceae bacterium]MDY0365726.1 hypothetical protein [Arcobacteraceae bacterium]
MLDKIFVWDSYSDQPHIIKDKNYKKQMRKKYLFDYIKLLFSSIFLLPLMVVVMKFFKAKKSKNSDIYGIGVSLDKGEEQIELIEELGVKNLLIRVPLTDIQNISRYRDFALKLIQNGKKSILINILQDRVHIEDIKLLEKDICIVFDSFKDITKEYQVGNAINRIKWGFFAVEEYLKFYKSVQDIRNKSYQDLILIGPSVIDFEYYYNIRAMYNAYDIKYDKTSALLYVDRRGSPDNTQYGLFDLKNKIDLLYALVRLSPKTANDDIYITETNWPISNTAPYAPTSEKECIDLELYSKYMLKYYQIAKKSNKIKRVYWHQLIATGYGLVDNRDGKIVKYPQFYEFKKMIKALE